jgi:hypothetical protein
MVQAFASRPAGGGLVVTRPAPPFRHAPSGNVIIIERTPVSFVHPFFFGHRFFAFSAPLFLGGSPVDVIDAPFFCWLDGFGFTDQAEFVRHLHEAHGVPLASALSFCELVGGRVVFFGF